MSKRPKYATSPEVVVACEALRAEFRRRRRELGLTQAQVSAMVGRSHDFISVCENHASIPNMTTMFLWAHALGGTIKMDWAGWPDEETEGDDEEGEPDLPVVDTSWARKELRGR